MGENWIFRRTFPILKHLTHRSTPAPFLPKPDPQTRSVTYMPRPCDGIGPLITNVVEQVMEAIHAPVYFERYNVHDDLHSVPAEVIKPIKKNKVCLKGGLKTPVGGGVSVSSLNVQLRKELDLYALLINCFNLTGLSTRHHNVDIVVIRENTEGEYAGLEHEVVPGVVESLKVITKFWLERIAKYACSSVRVEFGEEWSRGGPVGEVFEDKVRRKMCQRRLYSDEARLELVMT